MDLKRDRSKQQVVLNRKVIAHVTTDGLSRIGRKEDHRENGHVLLVRFLEGIITVSLVAIFFGLPIFFLGLTLQGIAFEKQIYFYGWILVGLVSWVIKSVLQGEMRIIRSALDYPLLILLGVTILSVAFSVDRWHSVWGFFGDPSHGLVGLIAMILGYKLIQNYATLRGMSMMIGGLLIADIFISVWAFLRLVDVPFFSSAVKQFVPLSLLGSLSGLGAFVSIMTPLLMMVIFVVQANKKIPTWKRRAVITSFMLVLVMHAFIFLTTYAFVPWIGLLVGVGCFLVYILARIIRPSNGWTWLPVVQFTVILVLLMIGNNSIARVQLPVEISPEYGFSWDIARETMQKHLLFGTGPATFGYAFSQFHPQNFNENQFFYLRFYQGTGLLFETLSTMGILGTLALLLVVVTFVGVGIYLLLCQHEKSNIVPLGIFSSALIAFANILLVRSDNTILILAFLLPALFFVSFRTMGEVAESSITIPLKASPKFALTVAFIFIVIMSGVIFSGVFLGKVLVADVLAGQADRSEEVTKEGSVQSMTHAIRLYGQEGRYFTNIGQQYMVLANTEALKQEKDRNTDLIRGYLDNSIALATQGTKMMPNDVVAMEALGQIYENAALYIPDSRALAVESYKKALNLDPHSPQLQVKLGQLRLETAAMYKGKDEQKAILEEANKILESAVAEKKDYSPAYYQLALAKEGLGDLEGAIKNMGIAQYLDPKNVNFMFNLARLYQARGGEEDNKIAEVIFKQIISINDSEINTHFSLGLLYEKTNRNDEALFEYQIVLDLLPDGVSSDVRSRVEEMMANIENKPSSVVEVNMPNDQTQNDILLQEQEVDPNEFLNEDQQDLQETVPAEDALSDEVDQS